MLNFLNLNISLGKMIKKIRKGASLQPIIFTWSHGYQHMVQDLKKINNVVMHHQNF